MRLSAVARVSLPETRSLLLEGSCSSSLVLVLTRSNLLSSISRTDSVSEMLAEFSRIFLSSLEN